MNEYIPSGLIFMESNNGTPSMTSSLVTVCAAPSESSTQMTVVPTLIELLMFSAPVENPHDNVIESGAGVLGAVVDVTTAPATVVVTGSVTPTKTVPIITS